ncbi:MAG: hypothetical protein U1F83_07025 [Verrucomicrobiota bacterium]
MKVNQRKNNIRLRLLAGWCGLLFYLGAFSPLGVGAVALLGTIDPDHQAVLQPTGDGMRLVLHHQGNCIGHHHRVVAQALTLFAQSASATDPDHVVQFADGNGFWHSTQLMISDETSCELPLFDMNESIANWARLPICSQPPPAPPPDAGGNLFNVRSSVLLI